MYIDSKSLNPERSKEVKQMADLTYVEKLAQFKIIPVLVLNDVESGLKRCEMLCRNGLAVPFIH